MLRRVDDLVGETELQELPEMSRSVRPQRFGVDALGDRHVVIAPVGIPDHLHPFVLAQLECCACRLPAGDAGFLDVGTGQSEMAPPGQV